MNTLDGFRFDWVARCLHWGMAILLLAMVGWGFYAARLNFYDPLYHRALSWHRSLGVLLFGILLLRIVWRLLHRPAPLPDHMPAWERHAAHWVQWALYLCMVLLPVTGYAISTADGRGVDVFGWWELPAWLPPDKGRETWMGTTHWIVSILFCLSVIMHVTAALKHHFVDRDAILRRMW
ncbi:MAG: cytochrome b [Magnetococcales bacterium]|nr:cytochrome b [Magnetococcales bacterium]